MNYTFLSRSRLTYRFGQGREYYWTRCPQLGIGFVFQRRTLIGISSRAHDSATLRAPTEPEIAAFNTLIQTLNLPWPADRV